MEIKINKDISKYKTKDFFIFSMNEAVYVIVAVILFLGGRFLIGGMFPENDDVGLAVGFVLSVPPIVLGFYKPKGYKFIDYVRLVWIPSITTSSEKIWQSDFVFEDSEEEVTDNEVSK